MGSDWGFWRFLGAVLLGTVVFMACVSAVVARVNAVGEQSAIEQLRRDIQVVGCVASEDVAGQVTSWNQKVASLKAYNSRWWADVFVPDSWDDVAPIDADICGDGEDES